MPIKYPKQAKIITRWQKGPDQKPSGAVTHEVHKWRYPAAFYPSSH